MQGPAEARIVFSRTVPSLGEQLFSMNADGTDVKQLTGGAGQGENCCASCSPDGKRICFVSRRDGYSSLWLMKHDGTDQERLTRGDRVDDDFPAWSPDETEILFSRGNGHGPDDLWRVTLEPRVEEQLTRGPTMDYAPCWSPDGIHIAFRRSLGRPSGVHVMRCDGSDARFLAPGHSPAWSPDGGRIAYSQFASIWVVQVDGSGAAVGEPARLTSNSHAEHAHPTWSPDGRHVAFDSEAPGDCGPVRHIVTMRADGSNLRDLGEGQLPDWSPVLHTD